MNEEEAYVLVIAGGSNEGTDVVSVFCLTWEAEYGITINKLLDANDCITLRVTIITKEAAEVLISPPFSSFYQFSSSVLVRGDAPWAFVHFFFFCVRRGANFGRLFFRFELGKRWPDNS